VAKTSLFTDIVGSTEKAVALGDAAWADLLEHHHSLVREQIGHFSGEEMDTSGDGFFVIFPDPPAGIEAGRAIVETVRPLGLTERVGIHHGDCYVADGKCTGLAIMRLRLADLQIGHQLARPQPNSVIPTGLLQAANAA
jgi:class 3 adenylate cyclase